MIACLLLVALTLGVLSTKKVMTKWHEASKAHDNRQATLFASREVLAKETLVHSGIARAIQ